MSFFSTRKALLVEKFARVSSPVQKNPLHCEEKKIER